MSGKRKKGKLPTPKATRASRGQDVHLVGTSSDRKVTEAKKPFKLSRFENIRSKGLY